MMTAVVVAQVCCAVPKADEYASWPTRVLPAAEHARRPRSSQVISPLARSHRDKICCANREYQRTVPLLGVFARCKLLPVYGVSLVPLICALPTG